MHLNKKEPKKSSGFLRRVCRRFPSAAAAVTAILLAGCGNGAAQTGEETTPTDEAVLYVKDAPGDLPEDLQAIRASGVLRVGIQSGDPPYYQEDPVSGELSGIDVDLAYEAASRIFGCTPEEARENNAVDIQTVTDQTGGPLLYDGKVDLLIGAKSLTDPFTEELNLSSKGIADPENGAAVNEGEEGEAGNNGSNQANDAAGEPGQPAETAPEVFREMWPERFSADGSEIAEADENATNESAGSGNDGIESAGTGNDGSESAGTGEAENGGEIEDTLEQEETPTPEPTQHWDFTQEYAEGRVLTVLHEKEGLSSQMNRLMQELVNSGKLIQITEKYTNHENMEPVENAEPVEKEPEASETDGS